jgi:hypothetical protein
MSFASGLRSAFRIDKKNMMKIVDIEMVIYYSLTNKIVEVTNLVDFMVSR